MSLSHGARWGILGLALVLTACGSHRALVAQPPARVGGQSISWHDLQSNVNYATQFYASPTRGCPRDSSSSLCRALRRQVLERLIEERVIEGYAHRHHIALSGSERRRAAKTGETLLAREEALHPGIAFRNRRMLAAIVEREMLVQRVEAAVIGPIPASGQSYHLRRYIVPEVGSRQQTYRAAAQLALGSSPVPTGTQVQTVWKAAFRVAPALQVALWQARPGHYIGPFARADGYQVLEFLGVGRHRYGLAAHQILTTRRFRSWLEQQLRAASMACYTARGARSSCPAPVSQSTPVPR